MALRLERAQASASVLAERLSSHSGVARTRYIERRASAPGQEHLSRSLLRLSVGIENVYDPWADLDAARRGRG